MKNRELMSEPLVSCRPTDSLSIAAHLMWEHDCGAVPVTDADAQLVGMITDRDICMATYTKGRAPQTITVGEVMAREIHTVRAEEPVEAAEHLMREKQVRRVPVLDGGNRPIGMLSLNDLVRHAVRGKNGEEREILRTMAAVSRPRSTAIQMASPAEIKLRPPSQN